MKTVGRSIWMMIAVIMIGAMLCACGDSKSNKSEQEKKVEMSIVVLEPAVDSYVAIEADKYQEVKATLEARLDGAGIEDFSVDVDAAKGRVTLHFPKEQEDHITSGLLTETGMAELFDPEGVPRMDSNEIALAEGIVTALEDGGTEYSVRLLFNDEGAEKLAEVTSEIAQKWNGMDLSLYMDDNYFCKKAIAAAITDGEIELPFEGTSEDMERLVNMINAGPMPFPMRIVEFGSV